MSIVTTSALNILVFYSSLLYEYEVTFTAFIIFGHFCIADPTDNRESSEKCFNYYEGPGVYYATLEQCGDKIDKIMAKVRANNDSLEEPHCGNYYTEGTLDCITVSSPREP